MLLQSFSLEPTALYWSYVTMKLSNTLCSILYGTLFFLIYFIEWHISIFKALIFILPILPLMSCSYRHRNIMACLKLYVLRYFWYVSCTVYTFFLKLCAQPRHRHFNKMKQREHYPDVEASKPLDIMSKLWEGNKSLTTFYDGTYYILSDFINTLCSWYTKFLGIVPFLVSRLP